MAFIEQNDEGTAEGATAYISVAYFKEYHADRGNVVPEDDDPAIERAIIKATDYLDTRFPWIGSRRYSHETQLTEWPRRSAYYPDGRAVRGIPLALKKACAEYGHRALTQKLNPDPTTPAPVVETMEKVDVIETRIKYAEGVTHPLPSYPAVDLLLRQAGLLAPRNSFSRA